MISHHPSTVGQPHAADDRLQIEMTGPDGVLSFACPDCHTQIGVEMVSLVVCAGCGSEFTVRGRTANRGRRRILVQRKTAD